MKRLRRILLNAATVLSLVLGVATVVLWVRGYSVSDELAWTVGEGRYSRYTIMTEGNVLVVVRVVTEQDFLRKEGRTIWFASFLRIREAEVRPASFPQHWGSVGLHVYSDDNPSYRINGATLSMWLLLTVWLLAPACRFVRWRARSARARASAAFLLCDICGYDCRATPDRCPECGAVAGAIKTREILIKGTVENAKVTKP